MVLNCGIVGLPNVGKSTLFNALTSTQLAQSANYPFCTIEPNKGIVDVPDHRLYKLAAIAQSKSILPTRLEFIDIAGLVKGASKGEGLGNQFLATIREVNAILHVVRCFEDSNIIHVEGEINPRKDIEIINTELILADLESLEKRLPAIEKKAKGADKTSQVMLEVINKIIAILATGKMASSIIFSETEQPIVDQLFLLTTKPVLYVCNVLERDVTSGNKYVDEVNAIAKEYGSKALIISAAIEQEISTLESVLDKTDYLNTLGLTESGLDKIITECYKLLNLQTFFTIGPKEARAWTIKLNTKAPEAAAEIHSDMQRGFIAAEVIAYKDYIEHNGEVKAKEHGKLKIEGKNYLVNDGDTILFRFNV